MRSRFADLVISIRFCEAEIVGGRPRWIESTEMELITVGGVWDRKKRRYHPERTAKSGVIVRFHQGQRAAALWVTEWLRRWSEGDWANVVRAWSLMLFGARASGKTRLACALFVAFCVMFPGARTWAVSATTETGGELIDYFKEMIPKRWRKFRLAKTGRTATFTFANGSRILLKSGVRGFRLKAGRVDLVMFNEAQDQNRLGYTKVRPRIADCGGLIVLTANPADTAAGLWVEDHFDKARSGEIDGVGFELYPEENPFINHEAFASAVKEFDSATADRELRGLRAPPGDIVMFEYRDHIHHRDPPVHFVDITGEVLSKTLGRSFPSLAGCDFQWSPHMSGRGMRIYRDPADQLARPLLWIVADVDVKGDEYALIDELGNAGLAGDQTAVIMDASGWSQDGAHNQGKTSERAFRARGWSYLFKPQKDSNRNPDIQERMKSANALLKQGRLFVAKRCEATAEAMRRYENINGRPSRRSRYAHAIDCVTYVTYRLFGVPKLDTSGGYIPVKRFSRRDEMRGGPI